MSEPRATLHIGSAKDLYEALAHTDEAVRLSVLQAIAEFPSQARDFGPSNGKDLIDHLIAMAQRDPSPRVRSAAVKVVANFRSRRVLEFLKERMRATRDVELVLDLEPRLRVEPLPEIREFLLEFLAEPSTGPAQALVAARLLSSDASLSTPQRLRVSLLSDGEVPPPPLDADSEAAWVAELSGSLWDRAMPLVDGQGDAILRLWKSWPQLSGEAQKWMLRWTAVGHPDTARAAIPSILNGALAADVVAAVLQCAGAVGVDADAIGADRVREMLAHPDARVRAAALEAGLGDPREAADLMGDGAQDPQVRLAALRRCLAVDPAAAVDSAVALLGDPDWRIRAAAADALVSLGEAVVDRVRPVVLNGSAAARPAAARVLVALRGEDWLEQELAALEAR